MRTSTNQPPIGTPLNRSHPLSKGLVANWLLNEGGGLKAFDSTGICNTPAILTNGAVFQQTARGNGVLSVVVGSKYINAGTSSSLQFSNTSPYSVSVWVRPNASSGSYVVSYLSGIGIGWYMGFNGGGNTNNVYFDYFDATNFTRSASATGSVPNNVWTHIVGTRNGLNATTSNKTYVNGVLNSTQSNTGTPATPSYATAVINIGAGNIGTFPFPGILNDVKVYNRELSPTEVRQLYVNQYQMFVGKIR